MSRSHSGIQGLPRPSYRLANSIIDIEEREGYLHVVANGQLKSVDEVHEWSALMEKVMAERQLRRALLDARGQVGEPAPEVRAAVWEWFRSDRSFRVVAYVVPEDAEMKAARINMTALSLGMNLRAFVSVVEAHRFLATPKRSPSTMFPAVKTGQHPAASVTPPGSSAPAENAGDRASSLPQFESVHPRTNRRE